MDFANIYAQGFARVAARVVPVKLADPAANAATVAEDVKGLSADGVCLAVYSELCLTGYSCGDLFLQDALLDATEDAIAALVEASKDLLPVIVVGAPLRWQNRLYNCAVVIQGGEVVAVVPKSYLPSGTDARRWFAPGDDIDSEWIDLWRRPELGARFASSQIIQAQDVPGLNIGIELCEDMWVPVPPSAQMALSGATVLVNLASSPVSVGKADARKLLAQSASARCNAAYLYAAAGSGESTTDSAWDGATFVYECGDLLGESPRFPDGPSGTVVDVDLRRIASARRQQGSFDDNLTGLSHKAHVGAFYSRVPGMTQIGEPAGFTATGYSPAMVLPTGNIGLRRPLARFPFVSDDAAQLRDACADVYAIQVSALARRLSAVGPNTKAVIGISGGLDSTQALLVACGAMDKLGRPRTDILGFTMPGFATSDTTKSNAWALMTALGVTAEEIDIRPAATQMMKDLGQPADQYDVTFENIQAGLRADYLFRAANQRGGLVVGTGDLSEAALGWCTYGVGDHISHYDVNAGLPKTLMQFMIRWTIDQSTFAAANDVLGRIVEQEISPELVPGAQLQSSESAVGPYPLNDSFLFHMLAGMSPSRVAYLAWASWGDATAGTWPDGLPTGQRVVYDLATVKTWLGKFYKRFFASQFKRSCSPDGPQVLAVSLSPRGGWQMPSDATPDAWLAELDRDVP